MLLHWRSYAVDPFLNRKVIITCPIARVTYLGYIQVIEVFLDFYNVKYMCVRRWVCACVVCVLKHVFEHACICNGNAN